MMIRHNFRLSGYDNAGDKCSLCCFDDFDAAQEAFELMKQRGSTAFCAIDLRCETWIDGEFQEPDEFGTDSDLVAQHVFPF